ncbi:MAG TPA: hypothetical protein VMT52_07850, partial [Planctomycetota bacterium]|nr:hypothetical protein [Planctomycetota bacterium]
MRRRKLRGSLAVAWIVLVLAGGVMINLYLALRPAALEARLRAILTEILATPFDFSSIALSWGGGAEIRDFRLLDPSHPTAGPEGEVIVAPYIRVSPDLFALLRGRFEVRQVVIDSPSVRIARRADSTWNVEGLLRSTGGSALSLAEALRDLVTRFPGLLIERGRITYVGEASTGEAVSETIDEVYAHASRGPDGELRLRAEVRVPFARKLHLQATASFTSGKPVVRLGVVASKVDLSAPYHRHFPPGLAGEATRLKLKGYATLRGSFQLDAEEGLVPVHVEGDLMRCELAPPHLPFPIRGLKGRFRLTNRTFEATGLEGTFGSGKVTASARIDLPESWRLEGSALEKARWSLQSTVEGFTLDRRTRDALPPEIQTVLDVYAVQGPVGIEVRVPEARGFPPRPDDVSATVRLEGVSFLYEKFPYLMRDLRGEVLIEKGRVTFKGPMEGHYGPIRASISGKGAELRQDGEIDITVKVDAVPLDEEFRNALPATARGIWDDFQLVGSGDGVITITRDAAPPAAAMGEAPPPPRLPRVTVTANPRQIRMSYRGFPYEIRDIVGSVHLDTGTNRLTFSELKGTHGDQTISGSGVVDLVPHTPGADSLFRIDLHSESLRVDQDLSNALSEEGRRLLADFNFKGRVAADVSIHSGDGRGTEVTSSLSIHEATVRHRKFPYPLDLVGGRVELTGDRAMRFSGFSTAKGAKPGVIFNGTLVTEKTVRTIEFAFDLEDFTFDDRLLDVLPPSLSKFVLGVKLGGTYRGGVDGVFSFDEDDPERYSIVYRGKEITGEEASVDFGLRIHQMKARGGFVGGKSPERAHHLVGEVFVESAWFNRLHLTNGEIDFTLGEEHAAIQSARRGEKLEGREYMPP